MTELTNDADKMVCCLYKEYLERRKNGIRKINAQHFSLSDIKPLKPFSKWTDSDIKSVIAEIANADFGKMHFGGGFMANDKFIIYMENRFKNGFLEVADFISKFIP